jgi:hypothetical protein
MWVIVGSHHAKTGSASVQTSEKDTRLESVT